MEGKALRKALFAYSEVSADADLVSEEILGPVAPIIPLDTEDEGVQMANDTPFGLVGYLFTQNVDRALRVEEALEVGMVDLDTGIVANAAAPFGGVRESGQGREGGRMGFEEFLESKYMEVPRVQRASRGRDCRSILWFPNEPTARRWC